MIYSESYIAGKEIAKYFVKNRIGKLLSKYVFAI